MTSEKVFQRETRFRSTFSKVKRANHILPCRSPRTGKSSLACLCLFWRTNAIFFQSNWHRAASAAPLPMCAFESGRVSPLLVWTTPLGPAALGAAQTSHCSNCENSAVKSQLFWLPRGVHLHLGRPSNKTRLGGSCHGLGKTIVDCVFFFPPHRFF